MDTTAAQQPEKFCTAQAKKNPNDMTMPSITTWQL